jgi:phosphatidylglycerophosphate synthase
LYAVVFFGLAWYSWQGLWAWVFFMLIVVEILLTAWDFVVEDQTRKLSPIERITHLILSMNGGAYVGFLVPLFLIWSTLLGKLSPVNYGLSSLLLTALGTGVLAWSIRDLRSGIKLSKSNRVMSASSGKLNSELIG